MLKKILILMIIFSTIVSADIRINEIMYDPEDESNGEYIELYNIEQYNINLEGWEIDGENLDGYIDSNSYFVIADDLSYLEEIFNININGITEKISLTNTGELILLKNNEDEIIDAIRYYDLVDEGKSLCKINNIWQECSATPGFENKEILIDYVERVIDGDTFELENGKKVRLIGINTPEVDEYYYAEAKNRLKELVEGKWVILEKDIENKDIYDRLLRYVYIDDLFVNLILVEEGYAKAYPYEPNIRYKSEFANAENEAKSNSISMWAPIQIKINEFLPNPIGKDDDESPNGEWVELYNYGNKDIDLGGLILNDNYGNGLEISEVNVLDSTIIKSKNFKVIYRNGNGRLELNNEGFDKVILYYDGIIIDEVSYSNSKEGISWGLIESIWQYGLPTPNEENKGNKSIENSKIKIKKVYGNTAKWGDIIRVKFDLFKADTRKNSIKTWIEKDNKKVSEETKMNIYGKYSDYNLILPIKIIDNCDNKFEDGKYKLVVEGLNDEDEKEIEIEGNTCVEVEKEVVIEKIKEVKEEPKSEKVIYGRNEIIYESSQDKIKRYAIFFMSGVIILLLLHYVWKK